jgi:hypothetical protein
MAQFRHQSHADESPRGQARMKYSAPTTSRRTNSPARPGISNPSDKSPSSRTPLALLHGIVSPQAGETAIPWVAPGCRLVCDVRLFPPPPRGRSMNGEKASKSG